MVYAVHPRKLTAGYPKRWFSRKGEDSGFRYSNFGYQMYQVVRFLGCNLVVDCFFFVLLVCYPNGRDYLLGTHLE